MRFPDRSSAYSPLSTISESQTCHMQLLPTYINLLPQAVLVPSLASSSVQKTFSDSCSAISFMASSSASLVSLPAELLLSILRYSRELSLINACREFRDCLPHLHRSLDHLQFSRSARSARFKAHLIAKTPGKNWNTKAQSRSLFFDNSTLSWARK